MSKAGRTSDEISLEEAKARSDAFRASKFCRTRFERNCLQKVRRAFALGRLRRFLATGGDPNDPRITRILKRARTRVA